MLPPSARGNVSWIAPAGSYSIEDKVIEVEFGGVKKVGSNCNHGTGRRGGSLVHVGARSLRPSWRREEGV